MNRLIVSSPASGPLADLMERHPGVHLEATPVGSLLLFSCQGDRRTLRDLEAALSDRSPTLRASRGEHSLVFAAEVPGPEARLFEAMERNGVLLIPPMTWQHGRVQLRLLMPLDIPLGTLESVLPGAKLISKTALRANEAYREMMATGLMLPAMTRRQGQSLMAALEAGYYDTPRKVDAGDVAGMLGIARSTFEEHLRSAESQIVRAVAPVVRTKLLGTERGAGVPEALELYARFSKDLGLYVNMAVRGGRLASVNLSDRPPQGSRGADHPYLARIVDHIATGRGDLRDIPLDLEVSPFERKVLEDLRTIPPGETLTYGDVARRLGRPHASRAVGNACARNPALVVVPCHRVVPARGGLGNYSGAGGPATKRKLLQIEGALPGAGSEDPGTERGPAAEGRGREDGK